MSILCAVVLRYFIQTHTTPPASSLPRMAVEDHIATTNWLQLPLQRAYCGRLCCTNTASLCATELLLMGGIFAEPRGELLSARHPDLRCLSTLGVGSEVDSDVRRGVLDQDASCELW